MFSRTFLSLNCRISAKSNLTVQKIPNFRSVHLNCCNFQRDLILRTTRTSHVRAPVVSTAFIRHISISTSRFQNETTSNSSSPEIISNTETTDLPNELLSQIPEPPSPMVISEVVETIVGEPSLKSLGLCNNNPSGMVQYYLEFLHVNLDMPWWATIVTTTVIVRTLLFPIVIRMQKYSARMNNIQPDLQYIQLQLADARKMGDHMEVMRLTQEMYDFMKEKHVDPKKNAWLPLIQAPIFVSFYYALRGMVSVPVQSMKEGGLWWFTDLTVPDPYCILPLMTSTTLFITLEMGTDTLKSTSMGAFRNVVRAIPIIMFPFIVKFEGAILCYWVSTNLFSLAQVSILRLPKVRAYFNIPEIKKHDPKKLPQANKKFVEGFKDSWTNLKVAREISSREMYDEQVFRRAGKGPVPKTYKYDPTKPHPMANAMLTKKKD